MTVVLSQRQLLDIETGWWPRADYGSISLYDQYSYDYATIYRTQPNVRTCVDFLARNIAQLGLHVFRRLSDTDRERLNDHPLARVLSKPLPDQYKVTRYRLIESLISDLGIYFNAYWLKITRGDGPTAGLLRIPPTQVVMRGGLAPTRYDVTIGGKTTRYRPDQVVHIKGYNPDSPLTGLSPLETLRRVLAEEHAAGDYREHFWQNAARMHGVIERPKDAPEWSPEARQRFKQEFEALYSGGESSGKTAILEEGMAWKEAEFNAQESEYLAGRKLTREECARAYHIPPPLVGILDHATFSNIESQHKSLYTDTLGPWLSLVEQDIELQLLPEFDDTENVYVEFNIQEKLQGAFEEQTKALQSAVGAPWMTRNEARARQNLPGLGPEGDVIITPLNVLTGGQANPRDATPESRALTAKEAKALNPYNQELRERHEEKWRRALVNHYKRQEAAILSRVPKSAKTDIGGVWWDDNRWTDELYVDLFGLNSTTATTWATMVAEAASGEVSEERMLPWLEEHSRIQAEEINRYTRDEVEAALREPETRDAVRRVFELALSVWAVRQARSAVTTASNFGATEGAAGSGFTSKTWQVNSSNPRDSHASMNGMTVGIRETFPNGQRWPGDPAGGAEENANCMCSVSFD